VDRLHRHRSNEGEEAGETFEWSNTGLGDMTVLGHWAVLGGEDARFSLTFQTGVKLPTGRRHVTPVGGEEPEPPARPGTGSTDGMLGLHVMRPFAVPTPWGEPGPMPVFGSTLVRVNGRGTEGYRVGAAFEASAGARYPLSHRLELTLGFDSRIAGKDGVGETGATRDNTGGAWVFATPGLRLRLAGLLTFHGAVQLPVYERVNGIQIVAPRNFVAGLIYSLD
jgi:hypothetical protein